MASPPTPAIPSRWPPVLDQGRRRANLGLLVSDFESAPASLRYRICDRVDQDALDGPAHMVGTAKFKLPEESYRVGERWSPSPRFADDPGDSKRLGPMAVTSPIQAGCGNLTDGGAGSASDLVTSTCTDIAGLQCHRQPLTDRPEPSSGGDPLDLG